MVEVFKTNVANCDDAQSLIKQIHENFIGYKANFDLEDCDLILRIESHVNEIPASPIITLLNQNGFEAELLIDDFEFSNRY